MTREVNKYPFSELSTLRLTDLKYEFPMGLLIDASFTPACANDAPFYVSDIIKEEDSAKLAVKNSAGLLVFIITIPMTPCVGDYIYGYGVQLDGGYCGACLGTKQLMQWLKSIPSITDIHPNSLIFSASAVSPLGDNNNASTANVRYDGKAVTNIAWGDNLLGGKIETVVVPVADDEPAVIKSVTVNGVVLTGSDLYITPTRNSAVRVIPTTGLTIGKVSDL